MIEFIRKAAYLFTTASFIGIGAYAALEGRHGWAALYAATAYIWHWHTHRELAPTRPIIIHLEVPDAD